jgi:hypothetical protein
MTGKVEPRGETGTFRGQAQSSPAESSLKCHRCGGLMVGEFCADLLSSAGELDFISCRCVQCGEVIDQVILQNRQRQQEMMLRKKVQVAVHAIEWRHKNSHPGNRKIPGAFHSCKVIA